MIYQKYPPFVIDDNGDILQAVQCDSCKTIIYMTDEQIKREMDYTHSIWCNECQSNRATQELDSEEW